MLRISTTTVEQYRKYMADEYVTEPELIQSIKGIFIPRRVMDLGSAYHDILESPEKFKQPDAGLVSPALSAS